MTRIHLINFEDTFFIYDSESVDLFEISQSLYDLIQKGEVDINDVISINNESNISNVFEKPITNIHLNVAQVCNLSCVYCYGIDGEYGLKGKMKENDAIGAINFLIDNSKDEKELSIVFFGGEPLLNIPIIKKVVHYCKTQELKINKKFSYGIVTNGTKFNTEINDFLNKNGFSVTISFDGDEETQNKNRPFKGGKESYKEILPKVSNFLKSRNGNALARATITNHSKRSQHYEENLRQIGFKSTAVEVATLSSFSKDNYNVDEIDDKQLNQLLENDKKEIDSLYDKLINRENLGQFSNSKYKRYIAQLIKKTKRENYCGVARDMRGIAVNGDIYPCHRFVGDNDFFMGNVNLQDTFNPKDNFNINFTERHLNCSNCFAKYYCGGGGCIHNNYIKNGSIDKLDYDHCKKMHYRIKLLFNFYSKLTPEDKNFLIKNLDI